MKKILFALTVLCAALCGCDTLDLSNVGYGDGERLKASQLKEVLYAQEGCWKAVCEGREFFFQFTNDGKVILDSDFLEGEVEGTTAFTTSSTDGRAVEMTINKCDEHFRNLGAGYTDTKFLVSKIPAEGEENKVTLVGTVTGKSIELQPVAKSYIETQVAPKADFVSLFAKNLLDNQSICDADGNLIGYYGLVLAGVSNLSVKVVTLENRDGNDTNGHTQYYESKLTKDGKVFKLDTPVEGIKALDGNTYAFKAIDCSGEIVAVDGMPGVVLASNKDAVKDFDYMTAGKEFSFGKAQNKAAACDEIWEETDGEFTPGGTIADVNLMKYDWGANPNRRLLVVWTWWFANQAWPGAEEGASILMNNEDKDRIRFKNISGKGEACGGGAMQSNQVNDLNNYCKNLLNTWFNEKGLFVVRHNRLSQGDKFYVYLLSPDTEATSKGGMWIKAQRKEE